MNIYIPYTRLPSTYQEVEYIQSSGTQYIDTGMKFTNNTTSDFDIAFTTNRSGWSGIIGAQYQNVNTSWAIGISETSFTYQQGSAFGDWTETPTLNQKYNFTNDATNVYVDGVVKKSISSGGSFTSPVNGTIFKVNYSSSTGFPYLVSAKLYKCKLYESGTLVRDFVPCYRKQDSVIGLYDLVNSVFYTNAGTGTFSKGNDVTMSVLKNIYIGGGGWTPTVNTIAYYPLKSDVKDYTNNGHNGTAVGATEYGAIGDFGYIKLSGSNYVSADATIPPAGPFTISCYMLYTTFAIDSPSIFQNCTTALNCGIDISMYPSGYLQVWGGGNDWNQIKQISTNTWYNVILTYSNGTLQMFVNGVSAGTKSRTIATNTPNRFFIGRWDNGSSQNNMQGYVSQVIIENKARTAQEVSDYYNSTKSNYGL